MKIALITDMTEIGGGESNLLSLAQHLSRSLDLTLFCSGRVKEKADSAGLKTSFFRTHVRWLKPLPLPSFSRKVRQKFAPFSLIHAYSLNALPLLFFVGRPLVWTAHGYWEQPFGLRARFIERFVSRVICVSQDVYRIADFSPAQKELIHLGSDFVPAAPGKPAVPLTGPVKIVCVGRFQQIKGQDLLVQAAQRLAEEISLPLQVNFVGEVNGSQAADIAFKQKVMQLASASPRVSFVFSGFQENVRTFIEAADLVVVPSRYESFSMVCIEALACGVPLVAPDIGGPAEIVNDPAIGRLFRPGEVEALKNSIKTAISEYAGFSRAACLARAADFSVRNQAQKHLQLYRELLKC